MKKRILIVLLTALVAISLLPMTAMAATKEETGIKAEQTVSVSDNKITVTTTATAGTGYDLSNVTLKNQTPGGYKIVSGDETLSKDVIVSGDTATLTTVFTKAVDVVNTGDSNNGKLILYGGIAVLSAALMVFTARSGKGRNKALMLMLCCVIAGTGVVSFTENAFATEGQQIGLSEQVTIGNEKVTMFSCVDYDVDEEAIVNLIGGRVFHIVDGDNGATYHFYKDADRTQECTTQNVAGLSEAKYYTVKGTATFDKFYVMGTNGSDPLLIEGTWGLDERTRITTDTVGAGKTNTNALIEKYGETDGTLWKTIKDLRATAGGHNDWFVGTMQEQNYLVSSGYAEALYRDNFVWSSVESVQQDKNVACYWDDYYRTWYANLKNNSWKAVVLRAF